MSMSSMPPTSWSSPPVAPSQAPPVAFTPRFYATAGRNARFTTTRPTMQIANGWVQLIGPRVPAERWRTGNTLMKTLGPVAFLAIFVGLVVSVVTDSSAIASGVLIAGALGLLALNVWWKAWSSKASQPDAATFPASAVGPMSLRYDWNGAAWGILLGVLGYFVIAMILGRKVLHFEVQLDPGAKAQRVGLKFRNRAEAEFAADAIRRAAMMAPMPYAA